MIIRTYMTDKRHTRRLFWIALGLAAPLFLSGCEEPRLDKVSDSGNVSASEEKISGEIKDAGSMASAVSALVNFLWQIEDIDGRGIIDNSMMTIVFELGDDASYSVSGSTGCNRYRGRAELKVGELAIADTISTRRACPEALMNQEQRMLKALNAATTWEITEVGALVIFDVDGAQRLRGMPMTEQSDASERAMQVQPQDASAGQAIRFDCEGLGIVEARFVGPENLELSVDDERWVVARVPSASGAKYADGDIEFWNKGGDAMLSLADVIHTCQRIDR